jgi:hypothetical protein
MLQIRRMDEIRKLLASYLHKVDGLLGIVLSDRDGVPIIRSGFNLSSIFFRPFGIRNTRYLSCTV